MKTRETDFFTVTAREIVEHLRRTYKPTDEELARWLKHPAEIDARVKGTEFEVTLTKNTAAQRAGLLAMLMGQANA